jgi:hypothetical protein
MATIRFAVKQPTSPDLVLDSVPAQFTRYVWDVDESTEEGALRAGRMRYLGQPYGVIELGPLDISASFGGSA